MNSQYMLYALASLLTQKPLESTMVKSRALISVLLRNGVLLLIFFFFFFSSRRRHTRCSRDWSSDVCSSDLLELAWKVSPTRLALAVWHFPSKFERCCQSPAVGCLSTHWKTLFRHSREHLSETTRRCAPFVFYPLRRICRCWWSSARHRPCLEESRPAVDLGCFHAHSLHGRRRPSQ